MERYKRQMKLDHPAMSSSLLRETRPFPAPPVHCSYYVLRLTSTQVRNRLGCPALAACTATLGTLRPSSIWDS